MVKKRKVYDLWMEYDNFLRSLHLETLEKQSGYSGRKRFFNYLKRLPIIFFASLLTTLTFQFFINPNKLFNSGLNGIIQVVTNYLFMKNGVSEQNRAVGYYAIVLFINILIVAAVQFFYSYNFEVNSTAIFYILFQFIWSSIFRRFSLQSYFFSRFSAQSWSNLSSLNQLGLTLPFYITIGVVSAIIHTYGYSLIYQAKSTPGGFEILTSTLAQDEKKKVSIGSLNKLFGIFVVFFITIFNFFFVNDNVQLKVNGLIDLINNQMIVLDSENYKRIENENDLNSFLEELNEKDYSEVIEKLLVSWSGDDSFGKLPEGIHTYFREDRQILKEFYRLEKERENIVQGDLLELLERKNKGDNFLSSEDPTNEDNSGKNSPNILSGHQTNKDPSLNENENDSRDTKGSNYSTVLRKLSNNNFFPSKKDRDNFLEEVANNNFFPNEDDLNNFLKRLIKKEKIFLFHIRRRIEEVKKDTYEKNFLGYFKYITNDEKLWASLIYIFFSSYLINQIFPKSKVVLLTALLESNDDLGRMLKVLQKYNPSYLRVLHKREEEEKENYLLFCPITKWDYQLLANEIKESGKVLVNTLDESN